MNIFKKFFNKKQQEKEQQEKDREYYRTLKEISRIKNILASKVVFGSILQKTMEEKDISNCNFIKKHRLKNELKNFYKNKLFELEQKVDNYMNQSQK